MPSHTQSLLRATIRDLRALVESLVADEALVAALSRPMLLELREIRICAQRDPDSPTFPFLARRMAEAAERLGFTEPSPLRDVALAAHHLAQCGLDPDPLTMGRHIFEARVALRNQRALRKDHGSPVPRHTTTHPWEA